MKTNLTFIGVAALALFAATQEARALPPRQHSARGVVATIDCANRSITLQPKPGAASQTFVWNGSTRFSRTGGCAQSGVGQGQTVRVSYRREYGQNVLREVTVKGASNECCTARE